MAKKNSMHTESLFCGILFCISLVALIIACLAYTKKELPGEYYGCGVGVSEEEDKKRKKNKNV